MSDIPTFPPLLVGHPIPATESPMETAVEQAASGVLGAGDLIWSKAENRLSLALVCEPDVARARCSEILFVVMIAAGDAIGAIVPPEISIKYQWPNVLLMNDGRFGVADLLISEGETDGFPDWMVVGLEIQIMPEFTDINPGENADVTTMWDEGCGEVTRTELLESIARHAVALIHTWSEDGFAPIHNQWMGRLLDNRKLAEGLVGEDVVDLVGLDESGDAILSGGEMSGLTTINALDLLSGKGKR